MASLIRFLWSLLALFSTTTLALGAVRNRVLSDPVPLAVDVDDFLRIQDEVSKTPQGGAIMFVQALMQYANGDDECVTMCQHAVTNELDS